jgi:hypothetical protein
MDDLSSEHKHDVSTNNDASPTQLDGSPQPDPSRVERLERSASAREALSDRKGERSASRGRSHVDKAIEATVKKPETGGPARSRKASHMMGIWDPQADSIRSDHRYLEDVDEFSSSPPRPLSSGGHSGISSEYDSRPVSPTEVVPPIKRPPLRPGSPKTADATLARQAFPKAVSSLRHPLEI